MIDWWQALAIDTQISNKNVCLALNLSLLYS